MNRNSFDFNIIPFFEILIFLIDHKIINWYLLSDIILFYYGLNFYHFILSKLIKIFTFYKASQNLSL